VTPTITQAEYDLVDQAVGTHTVVVAETQLWPSRKSATGASRDRRRGMAQTYDPTPVNPPVQCTKPAADPRPRSVPQPLRKAGWGPARIGGAVAALFAVGFALLLAAGLAFGTLIFASLKHSDAYQASASFVKSHPAVIAELGEPIRESLFPTGHVSRSGGFGDAKFSISLTGTRGRGQARVVAHRDGVKWVVDSAKLVTAAGVLDLAPPPSGRL
jgi:hypothetical protein